MSSISLSGALKEQKTCSQKKSNSKDKKIQAQMKLIEKQKQEIENLKAGQATGVSLQNCRQSNREQINRVLGEGEGYIDCKKLGRAGWNAGLCCVMA